MQHILSITGVTLFSILSFFYPFFETTPTPLTSTVVESTTLNPPPECLGERANLRMFYWNDIPSHYIRSIYNHTSYPRVPTGMVFTEGLEMPERFNDYYGALIRGYLLAPETGDYLFNVTGDNWIDFHLNKEADQHPDSLNRIAYTENATSITQHDKYEGQTSELIPLIAGNYYYFELVSKEASYNDFAKVYWQIPTAMNGEWVGIDTTHLYDYNCETICNPLGTPCDDGDATTVDDKEDGFCNCYGRATVDNDCIGDRNTINALYYDELEGRYLISLDTAASFPDNPTRAEVLKDFRGSLYNGDYYGVYVRAFLSVPVTGEYTFNVTADYESRLWISSGESADPADLTELCHVPYWTYDGEHEKYEAQTSTPITLQKGQYYYMEFKMKEELYQDHFTVWWKTPFADDMTEWQVVSGAYLYQYACETACIPANTPCNDGDDLTVQDMYDENCNCVGVPCDYCTGEEDYIVYEVCNLTDKHSNEVDSWQSCEVTPNPNASRGTGHWIMYDLNDMYQIHDTHIWNYNKANETGKGIKDVVIDASFDGISWGELGTYTWPQAPGTIEYEGFTGDNYNGQAARYVLITALNNWSGDNCSGFSELKMNIEVCPNVNTPCDDGNPNTFDDAYNEFCACIGTSDGTLALDLLSFDANWDKRNVLVEWQVQNEEAGTLYEVQRSLDAENFSAIGMIRGKATSPNKVAYQLVDTKGYQLANELFYRLKMIEDAGRERFSHVVSLRQAEGLARLKIDAIQPNPFQESVQIHLTIPSNSDKIQLRVFNNQGQFIKDLVNEQVNEGEYHIAWDGTDDSGKSVQAGIYYLQLSDGRQRIGRRLVKL